MREQFDLSGKVAIVTGASRGIGRAIAETLASAGAQLALASRKQAALEQVAEHIRAAGGVAHAIAAHNGDKTALEALVSQTIERCGRLDILVNNAATNPHFGQLLEADDSYWRKTIDVNLMGNVWLTRAAVPHMRAAGGGKIINIASIVGINPGRFQGIYSITKAGLISLSKTLALELAADNIQVNALAPGLIKTQFARALWENDELLGGVIAATPAGRIGQPADIAGMALFLASPASDYVTGGVFVVDGGLTASAI